MSNFFHDSSVPRHSLINWFMVLPDNVTHNWSCCKNTYISWTISSTVITNTKPSCTYLTELCKLWFICIIAVVSLAQTPIYISILPRVALWIPHAKPQALWGLYVRILTEMFILPNVTEKLAWDSYRLLRKLDHRDVGTGSTANKKNKTVVLIQGIFFHLHLGDKMVRIRTTYFSIINTMYLFHPRSVIYKMCNT